MKAKVYLDFQLFDRCHKDTTVLDFFDGQKEKLVYYCSTAHLEELWRAIKNSDSNSENLQQAYEIKKYITKLCEPGILNPSENGVCLKEESIDECLARIKKYDTCQVIFDNAASLKDTHNQAPVFSSNYHHSDEQWKTIWDEKVIQDALEAVNEVPLSTDQIENSFSQLCKIYGEHNSIKLIKKAIDNSKQEIYPNCFSAIQHSYGKLEFIIEQLSRILSRYGYYRDKNIRTFNSGEYDITHMIYATFCDYFVTQDNRLYNRALAIYYYLGIPTRVIQYGEFKNAVL